ncbi:ABC transporter ATP-binding protein [Mycetocola spongiae]|uniref:ABC transporter ATP-binding protein n=1 Tax=Mycetocola spongiae TaxID=2859226 RepID=UPI001CF52A58|nr:ABC transporter ATP-binding protein [Mycetocola spongiae]UCR89402.1 ABC transporter ATP-binding protein [Mycetocola spongiae]
MTPESSTPAALSLSHLSRNYRGSRGITTAVDRVSLEIAPGEVFGLLGPNGSGKTTLIECIAGLLEPSSGTVRVLGLDPVRERTALTACLGIQPQSASLFDTLTARETLELFAALYPAPRTPEDLLEEVGLAGSARVRTRALSGGQHRRLLIAVALIGNPRIVVLDEPSAGLDPLSRQGLWEIIRGLRGRGVTVLLSTHQMEEAAALCDRVGILVRGGLAALGTPEELIAASSGTGSVLFTVPLGTDLSPLHRYVPASAISRRDLADGIRVDLKSEDPDGLLRRLTFDRPVPARGFTVHTATLDEVFFGVVEGR